VVCAAGNDGRGKVSYPAAYPDSIAVAATQFDESTTFYSNWGKEIDVAAPGGNTRVDQNGDGMMDGVLQNTIVPGDISRNDYLLFMGTSMASPHVAGVAALLVAQGVTDPNAVEKIIKETARKTKAADPENHYGAGIIDAAAALKRQKSHQGSTEWSLGALLAGLVVWSLRRRGLYAGALGVGGVVTTLAVAGGLFFLPWLGLGQVSHIQLLEHGLPDLGGHAYGNPLTYSALIPLVAALLFAGQKKWRGVLAGLALGFAAHFVAQMVNRTTDVSFIPNSLDNLWLGANAAFCTWLGRALLRR
jgi:serine protease